LLSSANCANGRQRATTSQPSMLPADADLIDPSRAWRRFGRRVEERRDKVRRCSEYRPPSEVDRHWRSEAARLIRSCPGQPPVSDKAIPLQEWTYCPAKPPCLAAKPLKASAVDLCRVASHGPLARYKDCVGEEGSPNKGMPRDASAVKRPRPDKICQNRELFGQHLGIPRDFAAYFIWRLHSSLSEPPGTTSIRHVFMM
jgi:hypothetical protein